MYIVCIYMDMYVYGCMGVWWCHIALASVVFPEGTMGGFLVFVCVCACNIYR